MIVWNGLGLLQIGLGLAVVVGLVLYCVATSIKDFVSEKLQKRGKK